MYLTKMRPSIRCLYSAASMLARSLSAVAQSVFLMSSSMWRQTRAMGGGCPHCGKDWLLRRSTPSKRLSRRLAASTACGSGQPTNTGKRPQYVASPTVLGRFGSLRRHKPRHKRQITRRFDTVSTSAAADLLPRRYNRGLGLRERPFGLRSGLQAVLQAADARTQLSTATAKLMHELIAKVRTGLKAPTSGVRHIRTDQEPTTGRSSVRSSGGRRPQASARTDQVGDPVRVRRVGGPAVFKTDSS